MTEAEILAQRLARELKYLPLPELFGREVTIHSLETVDRDLSSTIASFDPEYCPLLKLQPFNILTMAKYGSLELTFSAPPYLLDSDYQSGLSLLEELGFIFDKDEEDYQRYLQDISENKTIVKTMLTSDSPSSQNSIRSSRNRRNILEFPPEYFPRFFKVTDACATNGYFVWY